MYSSGMSIAEINCSHHHLGEGEKKGMAPKVNAFLSIIRIMSPKKAQKTALSAYLTYQLIMHMRQFKF
jgi:hypothetical protein